MVDLTAYPVPTGREEAWRFTPLARLRGLPSAEPGSLIADGKLVVDAQPPEGVRLDSAELTGFVPPDRVSALIAAAAETRTVLRVPAGFSGEPVFVSLRADGGTTLAQLGVEVGANAQAVVVLDHQGSATYGANLDIRVGDGAQLTLVTLQDWEPDALHVGAHLATLGRDARLKLVTVTLGGELVRLVQRVRFTDRGGDVAMHGMYFADAGQHLEHRLLVEHTVSDCRSRVAYKGALQGADAHTVWVGDVVIRAGATGTDTYELNRNLLLTEGARADSIPNLEIETGEVAQAGHASATGRFDDEQLFYLQSRGIPADEARRVVVRAFFAEVIDQVGVPQLVDRLTSAVDEELARVGV